MKRSFLARAMRATSSMTCKARVWYACNRQAEAAPLRERRAMRSPVHRTRRVRVRGDRSLRVDRQIDIGACRELDQLPDARQQLGRHARALRILVAREQRAQLDRDAVRRFRAAGVPRRGDRLDRVRVRRQIALRIRLGARPFAEHVVAEAQAALVLRADAASPIASLIERPSTNCRPSNWIARTVAATTVCAPSRLNRPPSSWPSGRNFFDRLIALAEMLASILCGPPWLASNSALPS
jgi:hypothetical protein